MDTDLAKRIKQAIIRFNDSKCLGQEMEDHRGGRTILHHLKIEFDDTESPAKSAIVSRVVYAEKKVVFFIDAIIMSLGPATDAEITNGILDALAGRLVLRSIWIYSKKRADHETLLTDFISAENIAAFKKGAQEGLRHAQGESN